MNIGTAKPTPIQLEKVPHFLINNLSIHDNYDVRKFEADVLHLLSDNFPIYNPIILSGGSGLYLDAVTTGLDEMPTINPIYRKELNDKLKVEGLHTLQEMLRKLDPAYYGQVDLQNPQRVIRALEVCLSTNAPFSKYRERKPVNRPFKIVKIALTRDRDELYQRIDLRMDQMIDEGLFDEAAKLYPLRHLNALQTVGYSEIFGYLDGLYDKEETVRLLKRNSRRYAKRQLTWLRRDPDYHWFHPDHEAKIVAFIKDQMGI